jgi:hypothetical protein
VDERKRPIVFQRSEVIVQDYIIWEGNLVGRIEMKPLGRMPLFFFTFKN